MKKQQKATLLALTAILLWSTVAAAFKIALKDIDFANLLLYSSIIAIIALFIIIIIEGKLSLLRAQSLKNIFHSAFLGLINPFLYYLFVFKSYDLLEAQIAQPLNYLWPIMLVVLSAPLLKQKLTIRDITALLISFIGVFLIASRGNLQSYKVDNLFGIILALSSSILWALFWVFNVKDKRNETIKLFTSFCWGTLYTILFLLFNNSFSIIKVNNFPVIVYIGLFEMGITFLIWLKALQLSKTSAKISNYVFLAPFISLVFIHFIIGENIHYTTLIGLILIVGGIIVQKVKI